MTTTRQALIAVLLSFSSLLTAQPYLPDATGERFIDSLLSLMTLEEKIGQMTLFTSDWDVTGPTLRTGYRDDVAKGRVGAIFNAHTAAYNRELQRMSVEETRMGIPLLFGYDVIHGYRTIFPISLGEAASWDLAAVERASRVAAEESTAAGLHWTFAPMVDIARDPRWGRVMEGSGEDVYLGSRMAVARVRGLQGNDLSLPNTMLSCVKHYAAYGAAQAGRDYHTVDISDRVLRETYLPPFKAALDAGAASIMTSFNELNGIPATANTYLLREILRKEWGFQGFVVTDYTSINEMVMHGSAADDADAGLQALRAGVDMDMQGAVFYNYLAQQVESGQADIRHINEAVRNILRLKYALGLFEDPYRYGDENREKTLILSAAHRAEARDMARRSIVLLKNERNVLPLSTNLRRLAVIGPLADNQADLLGAWHADGKAADVITLLQGIKNKLGNKTDIRYVKGCEVTGNSRAGFEEAVAAARISDAVIVAVGEHEWMSGEAASRSDIRLPGVQLELVQALLRTGKPVVVVLMNGRPLAIPELAEQAPAILEAWFGGTEAGNAIADVLFGDYNPSGKLPISFPRSLGQVPIYYSVKPTGRPRDENNKYTSKYLDEANTPLFPFGYGLSYTTFNYGQPAIDQSSMKLNDSLLLSITVTNTGKMAGEETVQLYVRDKVGSVTRPLRELRDFQKIQLQAGESRKVEFIITAETLSFYRADMTYAPEAGEYILFVGGDSNASQSLTIRFE